MEILGGDSRFIYKLFYSNYHTRCWVDFKSHDMNVQKANDHVDFSVSPPICITLPQPMADDIEGCGRTQL